MTDDYTDREKAIAIAFLLEGEGCFYVRWRGKNKGRPMCRIVCGMTDEDTIRQLHRLSGVGKVTGPRIRGKYKPMWDWIVIKQSEVEYLLKLILPHMKQRRSARIQELLDALKLPRLRGPYNPPSEDPSFTELCNKAQAISKFTDFQLGALVGVDHLTWFRWCKAISHPWPHKKLVIRPVLEDFINTFTKYLQK